MSKLQYSTYPDFGVVLGKQFHYSQAVRVGDHIECSGQGGWDPVTGEVKSDIVEEIDQAFANVEYNLKYAGGKGWSQVFRINIYSTDMSEAGTGLIAEALKKWLPDHKPILTLVGVPKLGLEAMHIEVEVSALDA